MKLPPYPLRAVADERRRQRDAAQQTLGDRLAELTAAEERHEEARQKQSALSARHTQARQDLYRPAKGGVLDVGRVHERRRGFDTLGRQLERHASEVACRVGEVGEAVERVAEARRQLAAAAQGLSALEKHREKWRLGLETEHRRKEEKLMDEISAAKYARASS